MSPWCGLIIVSEKRECELQTLFLSGVLKRLLRDFLTECPFTRAELHDAIREPT